MTTPPPGRFQLYLSTCIGMALICGVFFWLNARPDYSDDPQGRYGWPWVFLWDTHGCDQPNPGKPVWGVVYTGAFFNVMALAATQFVFIGLWQTKK